MSHMQQIFQKYRRRKIEIEVSKYVNTIQCVSKKSRTPEAKERSAWMAQHRVTSSGALVKQKYYMLEKIFIGQVRSVELKVLQAVVFSPDLKDRGSVELSASKLDSFVASYALSKDEKMTKIVDTPKAANDYLLSMFEAYKKGSLTHGLKAAKGDVKGLVALSKATDGLQNASAEDGLKDIMSKDPISDPAQPREDVTAGFLQPPKIHTVLMAMSTISINKNSLSTFVQLGCKSSGVFGVMLGKTAWNGKFHAVSIVLASSSIEDVLKNPRVIARCEAMGLTPCGALVVGKENIWLERREQIFGFFPHSDNPLLVCVDFSTRVAGNVVAWEFNHEASSPQAVSLSYTTNPRDIQQRFNYTITMIDDFGVSHLEDATQKICKAIMNHVMDKDNALYKRKTSLKPVAFRKLSVPADGLCGFHSILAGSDLQQYFSIQRKPGGYPQQAHMVARESRLAKDFHADVCNRAVQQFPQIRNCIERVRSNPSFSPADLHWIAPVCNITVRVSCAVEARVGNEMISYMYISHAYIYM